MLYAVNTFGAVFGAGEAAFFLIEYAGLKGTLYTAVAINILIAFFAFIVRPQVVAEVKSSKEAPSGAVSDIKSSKRRLIFFVTGLSGMVAIAYQILWTRILTPATGTFIYAFAEILMIYLLGIAFGSLIYNNFLNVAQRRSIIFAASELLIGLFALVSVFVTSLYARGIMDSLGLSMEFLIMATMLPAALFMGISFPAAIDSLGEKEHHGSAVGSVYFYNTIGSIAGGFLASFFFIPFIGSTQSIILLAGINFFLAILLVAQGRNFLKEKSPKFVFAVSLMLMVLGFGLFFAKGDRLYEAGAQEQIDYAKANGVRYLFKEDETGSVFAYNDGKIARLIVDGIGMTGKDRETKMMAHVPISIHKDPKDMLAICFGMGTTFRSALKDGMNVDAVELSRAVADSFPVFYSDTQSLLGKPNARIIVNDGRNYISLTNKKYDIVAIDPPPPFNSAGTTVLYSEDFYRELAKKLKPGGLLNQWLYFNSNEDDIGMAVKSFLNVFPYAMAYYVPNEVVIGIDLVGSFSPIEVDPARVEKIFSSDVVKRDLAEFGFAIEPSRVMDLMIADRSDLVKFASPFPAITDDRPRTEYFLNRHSSQKYQEMTIEIFRKRIGK
jgi:spermidine synthase